MPESTPTGPARPPAQRPRSPTLKAPLQGSLTLVLPRGRGSLLQNACCVLLGFTGERPLGLASVVRPSLPDPILMLWGASHCRVGGLFWCPEVGPEASTPWRESGSRAQAALPQRGLVPVAAPSGPHSGSGLVWLLHTQDSRLRGYRRPVFLESSL